jgi:lysozyme family protein
MKMADPKQAVDFVMRQEDSALSGVITDNKNDRGGRTRFGLTERWHAQLSGHGFYDFDMVEGKQVPKIPASEALPVAQSAFTSEYAEPLLLESFEDQAVATSLLSFAVLEGKAEAATILQKAILAALPQSQPSKDWNKKPVPVLIVDGIIGQQTIKLANSADPTTLRALLVGFGKAYFQHIAANIPGQSSNLAGWNNRAAALLAIMIPPPAPTPEPEPQAETAVSE